GGGLCREHRLLRLRLRAVAQLFRRARAPHLPLLAHPPQRVVRGAADRPLPPMNQTRSPAARAPLPPEGALSASVLPAVERRQVLRLLTRGAGAAGALAVL